MAHLVALDLPGGPDFVVALRREWEAGNAVAPIDQRLPAAARAAVLQSLAPDHLIDSTGRHRIRGHGVADGDALVIATSGATGAPKGVVLTHDAVRASAIATSLRLGIDDADMWLACLPLAHIGGLSVVTRALHLGVRVIVHDGFDAERVISAARAGATAVSLVATALARIDASMFRIIVLGGSRPPGHRPPNVHTTYGLTETGSGVVYDGVPLDGVDVQIASSGEILLRGPMLMRGYRDGSTTIDEFGWLHTGDIGRLDADGRLEVVGRVDDLIITGGENVWPDVVEGVIRRHAGVSDVAVAGRPDNEWGQRVVAWIVPGEPPPTAAELRAHILDSLPGFYVPKEFRFVAALPQTSLGKIQRHLLE